MLTFKFYFLIYIVLSLYQINKFIDAKTTMIKINNECDDDNNNNSEAKTAIVVLGYKLNSDGTPDEILIQRVLTAVNVYKELCILNFINKLPPPLFLISGKGTGVSLNNNSSSSSSENNNILYKTEAEAIEHIALDNGVDKNHILRENRSDTTIQNAIYSQELLVNLKIGKLIISTSDFHLLRTKIIFQTIFKPKIQLDFISSHVSKSQNETIHLLNNERRFTPNNQKAVIRESKIKDPRIRMIQREINTDLINSKKSSTFGVGGLSATTNEKRILIANYYRQNEFKNYSNKIANYFNNSFLIDFNDNSTEIVRNLNEPNGTDIHNEQHEDDGKNNNNNNITNIESINLITKPSLFKNMIDFNYIYDYQISISFDMGLSMINDKNDFDQTLINFIRNSKTTFLELPEPDDIIYNDEIRNLTGLIGWSNINEWYSNRTLDQIFNDIKIRMINQDGYDFNWKIIGGYAIGGNINKLIRIDFEKNKQQNTLGEQEQPILIPPILSNILNNILNK